MYQILPLISYAQVNDVVAWILQLGNGSYLEKFNLKDAYRNIPCMLRINILQRTGIMVIVLSCVSIYMSKSPKLSNFQA